PLYRSKHGPTQLFTATRYGKRFVLKGLKGEYLDDPLFRLALAKEFEIGFSLDHPGVRRTLSLENAEGLGQVIVLEYIDGRSLDSLLRSESITRQRGREICMDLAEGLSYLHGKQTLHRDLKPSNVLITHQGATVKLIDFNLSDNDNFIIFKNPAGSGKYIAPELREPDASATPASDIYSLGVIAGEIAERSSDPGLMKAASLCTHADPDRRAEGLAMLRDGRFPSSTAMSLDRIISSSWLTYLLTAVSTALASFIAYHYITR
ncbi:MAG: protein kinase, partial [Muribaculaceae bacterium]|nr:protein kinase [Muribaculaceae bacterium]